MFFYILAFVLSLATSIYYMAIYRKGFNPFFSIVQILGPTINFGIMGRALTDNIDEAFACNCLIYLCGCFALPLLVFGTSSLCDLKLSKKIAVPTIVAQIVVFVSMVTTKYTGIFYKSFHLEKSGNISIIVKEYGPMHTVAYVIWAILAVAEIVILVYGIRNSRKAVVKDSIAMAVLLVSAVALFFVARIISTFICTDMLSYVVCQIGLVFITKHSCYYSPETYNLENLAGVSGYAYILFDENMNLLVCSQQAEQWFPELLKLHVSRPVTNTEGINGRFSQWKVQCDTSRGPITDIVPAGSLRLKFDISHREIEGKKCYCFLICDDTAQQELMAVLKRDADEVKRIAGKYIDSSALSNIMQAEKSLYENQERNVAVMFADLRNFTAVVERLAPQDMVNVLNEYLSVAEKAIHRNGGTVDKYIGDAVMAFWVDDKEDGSAAVKAAITALEIKQAMAAFSDEIYDELQREVFYAIGLNYGKAVVGAVGSETLKNYTVIGNCVNIASQLEDCTPMNTIYITEVFRKILGNAAVTAEVEENIWLKGKNSGIKVFELLDYNKLFDYGLGYGKASADMQLDENRAVFYVCGCRGSYPVSGVRFSKFGGETSCYIIKKGTYALVIDCGTGFINAQSLLHDCTKIDVILTHLHYDHCMGLLNWSVFPKGVYPTFYGNFAAWNGLKSLSNLFRRPFWPVDISNGKLISVPADQTPVKISDEVEAVFYDAPHPDGAKLVIITIGGKKICVMFDCEDRNGIPLDELQDIDYLLYDGTYDDADKEKYIGWGHSTWQDGVRLARATSVGELIITHHDAKSTDTILLDREKQARQLYPATVFARVGDRFAL